MRRISALVAAAVIAFAIGATTWAIGVDTGVFADGSSGSTVSASNDQVATAVPMDYHEATLTPTAGSSFERGGYPTRGTYDHHGGESTPVTHDGTDHGHDRHEPDSDD